MSYGFNCSVSRMMASAACSWKKKKINIWAEVQAHN
ncbi:hypothetical protein E1A91_D11G203100v1 [Gossypium mustelinum]|uniref:Uncharacterized protein n=1 Tax=Gossypium mustelinum TaxID=34275 RepID=A0A5D2STT8_GOSMU|nr:hypothetical protein E1A91_D11G203100v1 [Gossypium mustelinum]